MKIDKNRVLESSTHDKPILTDVFYKQSEKKKPIVIFCHGYKGFKDWGCWDLMAQNFVSQDLFFVKFNFSHNGGTVENPIDFPDLNAFGENNFEKELDDLEDVINWISSEEKYLEQVDVNNITLIGHSRGGGIVTIKASENEKVKNVVAWNGVSDYEVRFGTKEARNQWKKEGVVYIENSRTLQKLPHFYQFYENFKANEERFNIQRACKSLPIPHLIIYGSADETVKPVEAKLMHQWNPKSELVEIEAMNHSLGGKHPWKEEKLPIHLEKSIEKTIEFIKK